MKLLSSFKKELILATRSFYFYIEILFAFVLLAVLLFAIPEHSTVIRTEYIHLDLPDQAVEYFTDNLLLDDVDGHIENVEIEAAGETYEAQLIVSDEVELFMLDSKKEVEVLAKEHRNIGSVVSLNDNNKLHYTYYFQGYESQRLKNLVSILQNESIEVLEERFENQEVRLLTTGYAPLNDRENTIPPLLTFNGSLMGMFIMTAYVFLDKKEGVIRAYAVTASSISRYLLSKILVLMLTSVFSALVVVIPIMGFAFNLPLMLLLLLTSGFFASVLGLFIASFYDNIAKAFGAIYFLIIIMMLPNIAYFIPSWDPVWIRVIPAYPLLQGFKEVLLPNGDAVYTLLASGGFLIVGVLLFLITNVRFKKTLGI